VSSVSLNWVMVRLPAFFIRPSGIFGLLGGVPR
jgi:hypothetical protein